MPGAGVLANHRRHDADRSGSSDQDVLTKHRKCQRSVHRIAERVEDRRDSRVDWVAVYPGVPGGHRNILGESAVQVYTNSTCVDAQMAPAGATVATPATDQMSLAADEIAYRNVGDAGANLNHLATEFMAHRHGRVQSLPRPFIPRLDVQIGAANACGLNLDQHIACPDRWHRNLNQLQPWPRLRFHKGLHQLTPTCPHCHSGQEA